MIELGGRSSFGNSLVSLCCSDQLCVWPFLGSLTLGTVWGLMQAHDKNDDMMMVVVVI